MLDTNLTRSAMTPATVLPRLLKEISKIQQFPTIVEVELECDPIDWLRRQRIDHKIAWGDRGSGQLTVAIGKALHVGGSPGEPPSEILQRVRQQLRKFAEVGRSCPRFYGGFGFRNDTVGKDADWSTFGPASFWLPRLTLDKGRLQLVVLSKNDRLATRDALERLAPTSHAEVESSCLPEWIQRIDRPGRDEWFGQIERVKRLFRDEVLEKIVLARRVDIQFGGDPDALLLLARLVQETPGCYHFCFQTSATCAFLGATPERLFKRSGQQLLSEVVAGTRPRGASPTRDALLGQELLESAKDQLEHDIVRKSIRQRLHSLVERLEVDAQASLLKLANKQHLFSRVEGILKPGVNDGDLIDRLHPTPAVGGYPTDNALNEIQRLEPFERGWYAAPVGWLDRDCAEFAVAIRSGLLHQRRLSLFSGAGIVPGSVAHAEWNEIEHKISDFIQLLAPDSAVAQ